MELLNETKDISDREDATDLEVKDGTIEFKNVGFGYDTRKQIFKGLSFKVQGGTSVALVGETGGGKSSIMRLLYRFYDVSEGSITIDGKDIREVTQGSLRHSIGLVPQGTRAQSLPQTHLTDEIWPCFQKQPFSMRLSDSM